MKKIIIAFWLTLGFAGFAHADSLANDACQKMSEPCLPADLCDAPCDPIAD